MANGDKGMTSNASNFPGIEHVAWQVESPGEVAEWYARNFGFTLRRKFDNAAQAHFLADAAGRVIFEIYNNSKAPVPDYRAQDPLVLHIAFKVDAPKDTRDALLNAGASVVDDYAVTAAGDELVMMRDPWGFAIQLVKRSAPM